MNTGFKILAVLPVLLAIHNGYSQDTTNAMKRSEITIAANPSLKGTGIGRIFIGKNYRKEWTQPVTIPVLSLQQQGLIPEKEGGGKETKSLHMKDSAGGSWALRSVRKFPEKIVPDVLKNTLGEKIIVDDISASYPYGALSMSVFSIAAHIPYLSDWLVYLPDDTALGKFREEYKETLVLMEEKEPEKFLGHRDKKMKSISTNELVAKLQERSSNRVDQLSVLRARLLDNFVMDFDRHEGQWNWIKKDSSNEEVYFPVPKDRDQVFYTNQGIIPKIIASESLFPELQGFRVKTKHISTFNRAAQNFDRYFLTQPSQQDWDRETTIFINAMTDSVIDSALALQPEEIQNYSAPHIAAMLKEKRQYFKEDMMNYYKALSKTVSVTGTNKDDDFAVTVNSDGSVLVTVKTNDSSGTASVFYQRLFDPTATKEIRLYGLEGNDQFTVEGASSPIKIRLIGGPGNDSFINHSENKKLFVYDVRFEQNTVEGTVRNKINSDPLNNIYNRLDFTYNISGLGPALEISPINGFLLGLSYKSTTHGFHKEPYSAKQTFGVTHSLNSSSFHVWYNADLIDLFAHTDMLIRTNLMLPTNRTDFFGLGNNTAFDKTKHKQDYYHMRYNIASMDLLARTHLGNQARIEYGPVVEYLKMNEKTNSGKFIGTWSPMHVNDQIFQNKWYGGVSVRFVVDSRNNEMLTTRGVAFNTYLRTLRGLNKYSYNFSQIGASLALYTDFSTKGTLVFASLFGGNHNIGIFEPEQSQFLGFTEHLRGYVSQRFAGRSDAYNQTELRLKFGKINALLVRADYGLYGFNDVGRVWTDNENSADWHDGYGGGIWLSAMKKFVVTGYLSFSKEVKALPWVTLGFAF